MYINDCLAPIRSCAIYSTESSMNYSCEHSVPLTKKNELLNVIALIQETNKNFFFKRGNMVSLNFP